MTEVKKSAIDAASAEHRELPEIHCTGGIHPLPTVSAHLLVTLRNDDCHMLSIVFYDDKGTDEVEDDESYILEFDTCMLRHHFPHLSIPLDTYLHALAETGDERPILKSPMNSAEVLTDLISEMLARNSILDISHRDDDQFVLVEFQCGNFSTQSTITIEVALRFFKLFPERFGDPIEGELRESPIEDLDEDDIKHFSQ